MKKNYSIFFWFSFNYINKAQASPSYSLLNTKKTKENDSLKVNINTTYTFYW